MLLEKQNFTKWSELDDIGLKAAEGTPEYEHLLKTKGADEIARRKQFLGLA
jgi:hypothetical protein